MRTLKVTLFGYELIITLNKKIRCSLIWGSNTVKVTNSDIGKVVFNPYKFKVGDEAYTREGLRIKITWIDACEYKCTGRGPQNYYQERIFMVATLKPIKTN